MARPLAALSFLAAVVAVAVGPRLAAARAPLVSRAQLPLKTESRWIVGQDGKRVKWACVNWSGAAQKDGVAGGLQHQPADDIARTIADLGFNCVRIPWSVAMVVRPHEVNNATSLLAANPKLVGQSTLDILDAVVQACSRASLMVILDNHMSDPDWCCSESDENGLWYNDRWPEQQWIQAHVTLAKRYANEPYVVASELRNELRGSTVGGVHLEPTWGSGSAKTDWLAAAERAGAAILQARASLLIVVDGLSYSTDFTRAYSKPPTLPVAGRLVYSAHDYSWSQSASSQQELATELGDRWGFLLTQNRSFTAPVWVSEFGTWHDGRNMGSGWWPWFLSYLRGADFDWGYWRVDGTESRGTGRTFGGEAGFGILNVTWNGPAADGALVTGLAPLQAPTQGPGINF